MPKSTKCTNFPLCQGPGLPQGRARCPGEGGGLHQEVLAYYNPREKGTQLYKASLKMLFVKADTHLPLPLVLSTEVKPAFTQDLKSLIFSLGLSEAFHFG